MYTNILLDSVVATTGVAELSTTWLVIAGLLGGASLSMMFFPRLPACIVAYLAMWAANLSGYTPFTTSSLIFWGAAVVIVVINRYLLPAHIRNSGRGLGYMAGGALVGVALGLTMLSNSTIIVGAMVGCLLGSIAYARTTRGSALGFPSARFFNYLGAKGIPAVIAAVMVGFVLLGLISYNINIGALH